MAFKTMTQYEEEKYGGKLVLSNDKDFADVVFLYQSSNEVLIGDVHYIKSDEYSGYVHCTGRGCPVCAKNIRIQPKLFVPLYNLTAGEIQFFDRSDKFRQQLLSDVFSRYPNPSEFVFRITRNGAAYSKETKYGIQAMGTNRDFPMSKVLADNHIKFPDHYETVCKSVDPATLATWVSSASNGSGGSAAEMPAYTVTPRVAAAPYTPPPAALPENEELEDGEVNFN